MDIQLNLINNSQDVNNSQYVIFQKNVAENFGEIAIAWIVVSNLGITDNHPFTYPMQFQVSGGDAWGNFTPKYNATNGEVYEMVRAQSGDELQKSSKSASSPTEVEVLNSLETGGISANIFRNGLLLAAKTNISPSQKAVFEFKPRIFIGAVSQVEQGQVMNSAILQNINTEIDLLGITGADIVITGGGGDEAATKFVFSLTNVI